MEERADRAPDQNLQQQSPASGVRVQQVSKRKNVVSHIRFIGEPGRNL